MTNRRKFIAGLLGTTLAPAALHAAEDASHNAVYDNNGRLVYLPCQLCPDLSDEPLTYGEFGIVSVGAQSLEKMYVHVRSEYVETEWRDQCQACGSVYPTNTGSRWFEMFGNVGDINAIPGGLRLIIPSCEIATVTVSTAERIEPAYGGKPYSEPREVLKQFKPKFDRDTKSMEFYI